MPSILRLSAAAALVTAVAARSNHGSMPSQTIGHGIPIYEAMPTEPPSLELVKRQLEKKSLTNICSEWTILGDNGHPQCYNSQTCLFSSVGGTYFEGCGMTSIAYDWITECSDYPVTGTAGPSQTFCNSLYPSCGTFEFIFKAGSTFSNYGCGTKAYSYVATLLATSGSVDVEGVTSATLDPGITVTVTSVPTDRISSGENSAATGGPATLLPKPVRKKSTPIGAIVGGVVGGIAVIALIAFLAWFFLRKRKQDKDAAAEVARQQANTATAEAYHNTNHIPEVDGTNTAAGMSIKPGAGAFAPVNPNYTPPSEKPIAGVAAHEYRPTVQSQYSSGYGSDDTNIRSGASSPPPMYPHPASPPHGQQQTQFSSPSSQFTELATSPQTPHQHQAALASAARQSSAPTISTIGGPPVSPAGTNTNTFVSGQAPSELGGGENRMSYQAYNPPPQSPPIPEMSAGAGGASSGGVNRRPVAMPATDMSGAPMSENYSDSNRAHELP